MSPQAANRRAAFTLLQVLVALGLVLAMLGAVFAFLHDIIDSRDRTRGRAQRQDAVGVLFDRLESDLALAIAGEPAVGSGVIGDRSSLRVLARGVAPEPASPRRGLLDLQRHGYRHDPQARAVIATRGPSRGGTAETIVLDGRIDLLRLRYHDGRAWRERFDSRADGGLPAAVEVSVWFELPESILEELTSLEDADATSEVAEANEGQPTTFSAPRGSPLPKLPPPDRVRVIAVPDGGTPEPDPSTIPDSTMRGAAWAPPRSLARRRRRCISAGGAGQSQPHDQQRQRRAFLLIAVLVALAIALAVVAGMLMLVRGEVAAAATRERQAQSRALAWSGVQIIGALLEQQRPELLTGAWPEVPTQLVIYETPSVLGVVRLLQVGVDARGEPSTLRAEGGLLDLNRADAGVLTATGLVDAAQAEAILAVRRALGGRFLSESELLEVRDLSPERLYGAMEAMTWAADAGRRGDWARRGVRERAGRGAGRGGSEASVQASASGLLDVVTAFAVEPQVRRDGQPRISLAGGWSDSLGRELAESLPKVMSRQVAENTVRSIEAMLRNSQPQSDAALCRLLSADAETADLAGLLDAVTVHPGPWRPGRIDINSAPYEAVLSVPGISEQVAAEIVRQRESLSPEERWSPTWLLSREIVDRAQFEALVELVTTRCLLWRVRLAAGVASAEDPDGPLENALAWEAVIDLSGPRWRLAYLRDATLLPLAAALLSAHTELESDLEPGATGSDTLGSVPGTVPAPESAEEESDAGEDDVTGADEPNASKDGSNDARQPAAGAARRDGTGPPGQAPAISPPRAPQGPGPVGRWRTQ